MEQNREIVYISRNWRGTPLIMETVVNLIVSKYDYIKKLGAKEFRKLSEVKKVLIKEDRKNNTDIASQRISSEHAVKFMESFRIVADYYRNRRK